mmetsp:Transcript_9658/g.29320  ORF Transcript_9658/g.29320 Transcript_9658/m.29320 type:complete len:697 (-) Transcript_9658:1043-3133(-)
MEAIKELSGDLKDATEGSGSSARIFALRARVIKLEEQCEERRARADRAEAVLSDTSQQLKALRGRSQDLKERVTESIRDLRNDYEDMLSRETMLRNTLKKKDEELSDLKSTLAEERERFTVQLTEHTMSAQEVERKLQLAEMRARQLETKVANTERQLRTLEHSHSQHVDVLDAELHREKERRLALEQAALENARDQLNESIRNGESELSISLRRENAELRRMKLGLETEVELLRKQTSDLEKRFHRNSESVDEARALKKKVKELEVLAAEARAATETVDVLKAERKQICELIEKLSPNASLQDGLQVLRAVASGKPPEGKRSTDANMDADQLSALRLEKSKLQTSLDRALAKCEQLQASSNRLGRRAKVLEKERIALKTIIGAYEEDLASDSSEVAARADHVKYLQNSLADKEESIAEMEAELLKKENQVAELKLEKSELAAQRTSIVGPDTDKSDPLIASLRAKLLESIRKNEDSEGKLEEMEEIGKRNVFLEETVRTLEVKIAKLQESQRDDGVKILHLKQGPLEADKAEEGKESEEVGRKRPRQQEKGKQEQGADVSALRNRVAELEEALKASQREDLVKAAADAEKRAQRTREVAKVKIEEFRLACYNLFGYKMQVNGAKYTLSSMYAEREEDVLCFGRSEAGGMELLETAYCSRISDELDQFLRRFHSIPALLAHITTDNFQKTTAFAGS